MENQKPIKTAVIGMGRSGWGIHAKQLKERGDYQIVSVADPNEAVRQRFAKELGCEVFDGIDSLLKATDAELVVVATPNHLHVEDTLKVIETGRHCVVEKPIAFDYAGGKKLIEGAKRTGMKVFAHHQRRFSDEFLFLKEIIGSGILGQVFEIRLSWGGYARRNDWQTLAKYDGGLLNNHGPHAMDMILNIVDSPVLSVCGDLKHVKDAGDVDDHFHLFMKTGKGQVLDVMVSSSQALAMPRTLILGSCGTLLADNDKEAKLRYYDPKAVEPRQVIEGFGPGTPEELPWVEEVRPMKPKDSIGGFYDDVAACLRKGKAMHISLESAVEVVRVLEEARKSTNLVTL